MQEQFSKQFDSSLRELKQMHGVEMSETVGGWERKVKEMSEAQQVLAATHANEIHNLKQLHQQALDALNTQHNRNINVNNEKHA